MRSILCCVLALCGSVAIAEDREHLIRIECPPCEQVQCPPVECVCVFPESPVHEPGAMHFYEGVPPLPCWDAETGDPIDCPEGITYAGTDDDESNGHVDELKPWQFRFFVGPSYTDAGLGAGAGLEFRRGRWSLLPILTFDAEYDYHCEGQLFCPDFTQAASWDDRMPPVRTRVVRDTERNARWLVLFAWTSEQKR